MNELFVYKDINMQYPSRKYAGNPSVRYPEYPFKGVSSEENLIYEGVRKSFYGWGLDKEHYGVNSWNPLGKFIHPGDTVLIKPNMVIHQNIIPENGTECLYTNVSIVRVVTDYALIALKGTGKVIIADAPVQSCDWNEFLHTSGYKEMMDFYEQEQADVSLYDLRHYSASIQKKIVVREEKKMPFKSIVVDLGTSSAFHELTEGQNKKLRITDYDHRIMQKHHTKEKHEYAVSAIGLKADIIINLPKIKTHRLAGMTGALKNMVGLNTDKDYLPHHRKGSVATGGDQHSIRSLSDIFKDTFVDWMNECIEEKHYIAARMLKLPVALIVRLQHLTHRDSVSFGNWSGNDTIWRTVNDLNKIVFYADKDGHMTDRIHRRMLCIGDMVVGGAGEGPLRPEPVKSGMLVFGTNPVLFDRLCSELMGFDYKLIPTICNANNLLSDSHHKILFNSEKNVCSIVAIERDTHYKPASGWEILDV